MTKISGIRPKTLVLCAILISTSFGAIAASSPAGATHGRPNCGDYSILGDSPERSIFERHCGTLNESDHEALAAALERLHPTALARASANRKDFRLAALIPGGMPRPGQTRYWVVRGVECRALDDNDIAIWLKMSDVLFNLTYARMQSGMRRFSMSYNAALLNEPGFPKNRSCTLTPDQ